MYLSCLEEEILSLDEKKNIVLYISKIFYNIQSGEQMLYICSLMIPSLRDANKGSERTGVSE